MRRRALLAVCLSLWTLACLLPGPARAAGDPLDAFRGLSGELRVTGSDVGLVAAREAAERITAAHPGVTVSFTMTGAGVGLSRVRLRQADICLFDRSPRAVTGPGASLEFIPYGVDPVAVVVNSLNPVESLDTATLRKLFAGLVPLWSDAGGGAFPVMAAYMEASEEEGRPLTMPRTVSLSSQPALRFTLIRNKEILGFISVRDLDAAMKPVAVDGQAPTVRNFLEGRWRIYRVMHLAAARDAQPLARAFADYLRGPEGQAILERAGHVALARKPDWESALPVDQPDVLASGQ
ncbi:Phosphate-binding protein PstS 1 [Fundidesulfovibrio magnetotacticus]|uniref:Phosphate-binding protein PstS 1 n=1 Tax=Fundidesulfovibrio magnetotacticus TaxID=2730080 RepID=A0A6V8LVE6_9BACT|nr:substrate-binding domain-containing protein [Fundidesulfovibrio magnetotacticus]GFK94278.1 Phosphate-binding protein PstS 1 [Fundidesulfovibrio magnetotacticus]